MDAFTNWTVEVYTLNPLFPSIGRPYQLEETTHETLESAIQHKDAAFASNAYHVFVWEWKNHSGGRNGRLILSRFVP